MALDKAQQNYVVVGVGSAIGGGLWYWNRTSQRKKLQTLLEESPKIKLLRSLSVLIPPPKELQIVAKLPLDEVAGRYISFFSLSSADGIMKDLEKEVKKHLNTIPASAVDRLKDTLGLSEQTVKKVKNVLEFLQLGTGVDAVLKEQE